MPANMNAINQAPRAPAREPRRRLPRELLTGGAGITSPPELFPGQTDRDILLTRPEAAVYLKTSLQTLENWSRNKQGPAFVRVGRGVRYRLSDLRAFVEEGCSTV
jgi:excisionase family DNA binding protein